MGSTWQDTDSEDELPPGWEQKINPDGRIYFADHVNQATQWTHPVTGRKKIVPENLPHGWTSRQEEDGTMVFIETFSGKETKTDPRLAFARTAKQSLYDLRQNFDASSTASAVLHGVDLSNKKALITGANCGIGLETAKELARHGCEVIIACRDEVKAREAIKEIKEGRMTGECHFVKLDLCSLQSVKDCANEIRLKFNDLDLLILNAGTFGESFGLTENNYERTFQINHLSHFYLTLLLKPVITAKPTNRIIVLASESHRFSLMTKDNISKDYLSPPTSKNFTSFMAYNDSKLCNVLMAAEISRRWSIRGVTCNSVHPGNMVSTNISRHWWIYRLLFAFVRPFTKSLQQAAATTIWGATAPELKGISGQYLNNCWLCKPSSAAEDVQLARKLWSISESMIEQAIGPIPTLTPPISQVPSDNEEDGDGKSAEKGIEACDSTTDAVIINASEVLDNQLQ